MRYLAVALSVGSVIALVLVGFITFCCVSKGTLPANETLSSGQNLTQAALNTSTVEKDAVIGEAKNAGENGPTPIEEEKTAQVQQEQTPPSQSHAGETNPTTPQGAIPDAGASLEQQPINPTETPTEFSTGSVDGYAQPAYGTTTPEATQDYPPVETQDKKKKKKK